MSKIYVEPDYTLLFVIEYTRNKPDYSKLVSYINSMDIDKLHEKNKYACDHTLSDIITVSMVEELYKAYMDKIGEKYPEDDFYNHMKNRCLEAVRLNRWDLKYVKEQTEEICLEAVRRNGLALKYVKEQTEEICLESVRQDGYALQYVEEQTEEMCLEAVRQDGRAFQYVREQTEEICLEAIRRDIQSIWMNTIDIDHNKLCSVVV